MKRPTDTRAQAIMRRLAAGDWMSEALLVDATAEAMGGDEAARLTAQRCYDQHFKITEPN